MSAPDLAGRTTRLGALELITLAHPAGSRAIVSPYGAHVISFVPAGGSEVLFVSEAAAWDGRTAIRGGIPVIFPQFAGLGPLPRHGFARTVTWEPAAAAADRIALRLRDDAATRAIWPHGFLAELSVTLQPRALVVALGVTCTGDRPLRFTAALHTYIRVGDVRETSLDGLRGVRYRSGVEGVDGVVDDDPTLVVRGELDRTYLDAPGELVVHDRAAARDVRLVSEGFADAVVWNPGAEKARALSDMAGDEWLRMLCVEAAQVGSPVTLGPAERWRGVQRIEV